MKGLSIPAFRLVVSGPDRDVNLPIPAWEFTMSALRELEVRTEGGREYMRPDAKPRPLDVYAQKNRLFVLTAASAATLLYTLWRYGQWPGRRRKPFARASRELEACVGSRWIGSATNKRCGEFIMPLIRPRGRRSLHTISNNSSGITPRFFLSRQKSRSFSTALSGSFSSRAAT